MVGKGCVGGVEVGFMTGDPTIFNISPPGISLFPTKADYIKTNTMWSHIRAFVWVSLHVNMHKLPTMLTVR